MSVWAIMRVKDEADCIETVVRHTLEQVDSVLIADNGSTDGTREILETLPVTLLDDPDIAYNQADAMSRLAEQARGRGAEWVVSVDADEIWLTRTRLSFSSALTTLPRHVLVAQADLYDHVATGEDPPGDPITSMRWRRARAAELPKVACRARAGLRIHQGNHGASFPGVDHPPTVFNILTVRHFPYRSVEQFVSKARNGAAAYAATDLPEEVGAHWRGYGRILEAHGEEGIAELFYKWHWREHPDQRINIEGEKQGPLIFDPAPVACPSPA